MSFSYELQEMKGTRETFHHKFKESISMTLSDKANKNIQKVLSKNGKCVINYVTCEKGEVLMEGKATVNICYVDEDGELKNMEYAGKIDFVHVLEYISPTYKASCQIAVADISVKRVSQSEVTVELQLSLNLFCQNDIKENIVGKSEGCYFEEEKFTLQNTVKKSHSFVQNEELEILDAVRCVLSYSFDCEVKQVAKRRDSVLVTGDIHSQIVYMDIDGKIEKCNHKIPFKEEYSFDSCEMYVARGIVECVKVLCETNEVKKYTKVLVDIEMSLHTSGYQEKDVYLKKNFFSTQNELFETTSSFECTRYIGQIEGQKKFSFRHTLPENMRGDISQLVSTRIAKFEKCKSDIGIGVSGELVYTVMCMVEDDYKSQEYVEPFKIELVYSEIDNKEISLDLILESADIRRTGDEIEVYGAFEIKAYIFDLETIPVVTWVEVGEEKSKLIPAFTIYNGERGESLLDISRSLNILPEDLKKQNPKLVFPLDGERKIIVYKSQKINSN